tara:strand:+ start:839 stop:1768 length:930 start_codon:yes stop_codon:yes gene_type:complete
MNIFTKKEVLFVKFPIFLPIIYGILLYSFPNFETQLIFLSILILAETHFGATWPFFLDKVNFQHIKEKKIELIFFPILVTFFCIIGFFYFKNLFLLIFFAANMYHVTRQSYGVMNLYTKEPLEKSHYSKIIYLYNVIFFIIAFFRFYMPVISNEDLLFLNFSIILSLIFVLFFEYKKFGFSENFLTLITGVLIFYPVCFVSNPVHAIIMGVTMHYSQYLYLTSKVIKKRSSENNITKRSNIYRFWSIVIIYSIVMSILSIFGKNDSEFLKNLIFIPITGQMLHFYLDSQLWKFSEKHNRDNILKFIQVR